MAPRALDLSQQCAHLNMSEALRRAWLLGEHKENRDYHRRQPNPHYRMLLKGSLEDILCHLCLSILFRLVSYAQIARQRKRCMDGVGATPP